MKASPLILALMLGASSAQAFRGAAGPHNSANGFVQALGGYGGFAFVPEAALPFAPPSVAPPEPIYDPPAVEAPAFAPAFPPPYYIPAARPRRSGPKIIYIGKPPRGDGPRIIYGTD